MRQSPVFNVRGIRGRANGEIVVRKASNNLVVDRVMARGTRLITRGNTVAGLSCWGRDWHYLNHLA